METAMTTRFHILIRRFELPEELIVNGTDTRNAVHEFHQELQSILGLEVPFEAVSLFIEAINPLDFGNPTECD
jgi:hypothetical protein